MQDDLTKQLGFLAEIDALKTVLRQSRIVDRSRRENSAEHSWHLAMFAVILAPPELDKCKIVEMLLIHDLVEIDAGDAPFHAAHDKGMLQAAEEAGARRLFGMLPAAQGRELLELWNEFEEARTPEAEFAKALDRLQPLLLNTLTGGGTWVVNDVSEGQVYERYGPVIERGSPLLWSRARELVRDYYEGRTLSRG